MIRTLLSSALCAVVLPLAAQDKSPAQGATEQPRITYKALGVRPAPPPAPEPGDDFFVDAVEKQIVIGTKDASGAAVQYRIPLLTNVDPQVASSAELDGDKVKYSYMLTNGPNAKQAIHLFAVAMQKPEVLTDVVTPASFRQGGASLASWGTPPRCNWWTNYLEDLQLGQSAGPFGFRAPLLPGLSRAYVQANQGEPVGTDRMHLSMWLVQKFDEAWSFANNTVQPVIIGPKIEIPAYGQASQVIYAVRQEFVEAASLPEFASERARLTALAEQLTGTAPAVVVAVQSAIKDAGSTALQRSFYQAMAINLAYLGRL